MKYKHLISAITIFSTFLCFGQFKDYNNTIGFICGGAGSSTPIVNRVYKKIDDKKYSEIISMLYSKNAAENFLGVVLCEKLKEKGKIKLTEKDSEKIIKLYNSNKTVEVCGGCTFIGFVKLSALLKNEDEDKLREEAEEWMKDMFTE